MGRGGVAGAVSAVIFREGAEGRLGLGSSGVLGVSSMLGLAGERVSTRGAAPRVKGSLPNTLFAADLMTFFLPLGLFDLEGAVVAFALEPRGASAFSDRFFCRFDVI